MMEKQIGIVALLLAGIVALLLAGVVPLPLSAQPMARQKLSRIINILF